MQPEFIKTNAPFGKTTTIECGGNARFFANCHTLEQVKKAVHWAKNRKIPVHIHGEGSNSVVSDEGFSGLVLRYIADEIHFEEKAENVIVRGSAGVHFDDLVMQIVERELKGVSCLKGIPGSLGAAPVQNIGAYGQELADVLVSVCAIDLHTLKTRLFSRSDCMFGYRTSIFKENPNRYLILEVTLSLAKKGFINLKYEALKSAFPNGTSDPKNVAKWVHSARKKKSMLYDKNDPNHRSCGSFFTNPIVPNEQAKRLVEKNPSLTHYQAHSAEFTKLSAAWLIEHAELHKGTIFGKVGLSTNHTLALINLGGAKTSEIVAFSQKIQKNVWNVFGVSLFPEPVFIGFEHSLLNKK